MRTFVHFDVEGRIHSVVTVDAPEGVRAMVAVEPGMSVAEVEFPELLKTPTTEAEVEKIRSARRVTESLFRQPPSQR